jgi:hypothetical protein
MLFLQPFFVERVFRIFDVDASGTISKEEFIDSMKSIIGRSSIEKLKLLFQIYDLDGKTLLQSRFNCDTNLPSTSVWIPLEPFRSFDDYDILHPSYDYHDGLLYIFGSFWF